MKVIIDNKVHNIIDEFYEYARQRHAALFQDDTIQECYVYVQDSCHSLL